MTYCSISMILSDHSDAAYFNVSHSHIWAGDHIILSKDVPIPSINAPILTIAQIVKFVISSATKAELTGLLIYSKDMVPLRQSLVEMVWPQPRSPVQTKNSTELGVANKTIFPKRTKSMGMHFHWLCCCESKGHFRYNWYPRNTNIGNHITKNHNSIYYEAHHPTHCNSVLYHV